MREVTNIDEARQRLRKAREDIVDATVEMEATLDNLETRVDPPASEIKFKPNVNINFSEEELMEVLGALAAHDEGHKMYRHLLAILKEARRPGNPFSPVQPFDGGAA